MPVIKALGDSFCGTKLIITAQYCIHISSKKKDKRGLIIKIWDFFEHFSLLLWNGHGRHTSYLICPLKNGTTAAFILCCTFMLLAICFLQSSQDWFGKAIKNVFLAMNLNIFPVHRAHRWWLATKFIKSVSLSSI